MLIQTVRFIVQIISIPEEELFSETTLTKSYDIPVGFVHHPVISRLCNALFAVAEGWLLLDIG